MTKKASVKEVIPWIAILVLGGTLLYKPVRDMILEIYYASGKTLLTTAIGIIVAYASFVGYNKVYSKKTSLEIFLTAILSFLQNILWTASIVPALLILLNLFDQNFDFYHLGMLFSVSLIMAFIMQILTQSEIFEEKGSDNIKKILHESFTRSYKSNLFIVIFVVIISATLMVTTDLMIPALFLASTLIWSFLNQILQKEILRETN